MKIISAAATALFITLTSAAQASTIQNSDTGLSNDFTTETFTSNLADNTAAGSHFAGVTFDVGNYITRGYSQPNMHGEVISNFQPCCTTPTSMTFDRQVSGVAFNFVSNPGTSTFTALLAGVAVEAFSEVTNYNGKFYGFENISFDSIRIDSGGVNHAYILDNLEVQAVPEPETYALMLAGLGVLGFVARRRKSL